MTYFLGVITADNFTPAKRDELLLVMFTEP